VPKDDTALVYDARLDTYDFGPTHPFRPERVTNTLRLMRAYGLLGEGGVDVLEPLPLEPEDLLRVHSREYLDTLVEASEDPAGFRPRMGLGTSDNPVAGGMYDAALLVAGSTVRAMEEVLSGSKRRAFSIAGGLHHAHRSRAAGFCVINDVAIAVSRALSRRAGLRVLYLDIDAHHGDGVEEAFYDDPRVLTISIHQSGNTLFPGTGFPDDVGEGAGRGFAVNMPLSPGATDECWRLVFDELVTPLAEAFRPDVLVTQNGCDAHHEDPLTRLGMTLSGFRDMQLRIAALSDELCEGRVVATGGGGYEYVTVVPRAWTMVLAALAGVELDERLPDGWTDARDAPTTLTQEDRVSVSDIEARRLYQACEDAIGHVRHAVGRWRGEG
jgi:acetoin utilization protein AcuC